MGQEVGGRPGYRKGLGYEDWPMSDIALGSFLTGIRPSLSCGIYWCTRSRSAIPISSVCVCVCLREFLCVSIGLCKVLNLHVFPMGECTLAPVCVYVCVLLLLVVFCYYYYYYYYYYILSIS